MLTSSFMIDNVKNVQVVVGLSDLTTTVIVLRKPRGTPFYICADDWELFSDKLHQIDRKLDATFFHRTHLCATTTPQQHLILSYYPSWVDRLLHSEPPSITLSAKATSNLKNLLPKIKSVLDKMQDFTAVSGGNGLLVNPIIPPPLDAIPPFDVAFYDQVN